MKKSLYTLVIILAATAFSFAQDQQTTAPSPAQFTKTELLAFTDLKALLSAINMGQDYSKYIVRNFNLHTVITDASQKTVVVSEMGPGGVWSAKQKSMIEQYAKKGVVFTLDNMVMMENGTKGMITQPNVSFVIKD